MHHTCVNARSEGPLPEPLRHFISRQPLSQLDENISEPPKKRRKFTQSSGLCVVDVDQPAQATGEYITLAVVNVDLSFPLSSDEPIPQTARSGKHSGVLLKRFEKSQKNDRYHVRIETLNGLPVFDSKVIGCIPEASYNTVQKLIQVSNLTSKKTAARCLCTASSETIYSSNEQYLWRVCAKVMLPNATRLYEGTAFDQSLLQDLCGISPPGKERKSWEPRDFYNSVFVPRKSESISNFPAVQELKSELYPFQKRAVNWLLSREGVLAESVDKNARAPTCGFVCTEDTKNEACWINFFLGIVTTHENLLQEGLSSLRGGILSEEMGLGKTVEMIALVCLHQYQPQVSAGSVSALQACPATLIITPPSILHQWKSELQKLAPDLKVMQYEGLRHGSPENGDPNHLLHFQSHDVILTTYNVLAQEIHYAEDVPDRNMRHKKKYERRMSPLIKVKWWRVVLDEAQMIESGVSNAAKVAQVIPRHNAWCVSGTPVRKSSQDLRGLLIFLQCQPYCQSARLWDRLIRERREIFKEIFGTLALRHTKEQIRDEIVLPAQKRVVITVPFTQIEEQHYSTLFSQMCEECGLNTDGSPLADTWDPNAVTTIEKMRNWLTRLRQTCLHAEVGRSNRRALGSRKGPLRTVGEVLNVMMEQNSASFRTEKRSLLVSLARKGQVLEQAKRTEEALEVWLSTLAESELLVAEARSHLDAEISQATIYAETSQMNQDQSDDVATSRTGLPRQRLRAALEVEHMLSFFVANAYFQTKTNEQVTEPDSARYKELERLEEDHYERAKLIRKEMLVDTQKRADFLMASVKQKAQNQSFIQVPASTLRAERGGIESQQILAKLRDLAAVISRQADQIGKWRKVAVELLSIPLLDEEDKDLQGDEYEMSTQKQDKVYSYVDALRAIVADFSDLISGQQNTRIEHETKAALQIALGGGGHSPELLKELLSVRQNLKPRMGLGSVRGIISELRELRSTLRGLLERGSTRAGAELALLNETLKDAQSILTAQTKAATALEKEVELFTDTMNARLEYYRQLQHISDMVVPNEEELDQQGVEAALSNYLDTERKLQARISTLTSRSRYLEHLRDEATTESPRLCTICQQTFEVGILTSCGHSYCMECLRLWWHSHRTCPTCKKHLSKNDFHSITYKPQEVTMQEETQLKVEPERHAGPTGSPAIYSDIHRSTLNEIKNVDVDGSFGTKVDSLARHILWLREHDPGSKSIIFSQFRDFLDVLAGAFRKFKINYTSIDQKNGTQKFKDDSGIECFFLHAKAHSSGLNLVVATHVFLCEPLINTAIELQAVARVHRIGQHQQTTIWMYLVDGTVEKSIYDISVSRRVAHMSLPVEGTPMKGGMRPEVAESEIEAANTLQLEEAPLDRLLSGGASGGEIVNQDDLWNCLFREKPPQLTSSGPAVEQEIGRHLRASAAEERIEAREATNMESGMQ